MDKIQTSIKIKHAIQQDFVTGMIGDAVPDYQGISYVELDYTLVHNNPDYHVIPKSDVQGDYFESLVLFARLEADKAMKKFPQPNYVTLKIAEEAGEVVRGAVHYAEGRMDWSEVEKEIIQLLAMLIRFVTEGDEVNGVKPPIDKLLNYKKAGE